MDIDKDYQEALDFIYSFIDLRPRAVIMFVGLENGIIESSCNQDILYTEDRSSTDGGFGRNR